MYSDNESESEYDSEREEIDYASDEEQARIVLNPNEYLVLLEDKCLLLNDFMLDKIKEDEFFMNLYRLDKRLSETTQVNLEKFVEISALLDDYSNRLKGGDRLTYDELRNLTQIFYSLKKITDPEKVKEKERPSNYFLWNKLSPQEQEKIKKIASKSKKNPIYYPEQKDYKSDEAFKQAEEDFLERFALFIPIPNEDTSAVLNFYSEKEKEEIDSLAKKLHIKQPRKNMFPSEALYNSALAEFYKEVSQLLPGYIRTMSITSIGYNYEAFEENKLRNEVQLEKKLFEELPIRITLNEMKAMRANVILSYVLRSMDKNVLINCIMKSGFRLPEPDQPPRQGKTITLPAPWFVTSSKWLNKDIYNKTFKRKFEEPVVTKKKQIKIENKPNRVIYYNDDILTKISKLNINEPVKSLNLKDLDTSLAKETERLKQLKILQAKINSKTYNGDLILLWKPSANVVKPFELNTWNNLVAQGNIERLHNYKQLLMKKYRLETSNDLTTVIKLIDETEKKIKEIENVRMDKLNESMKKWKIDYTSSLQEKYNALQPLVNEEIVNQLVDSYKRNILANRDFKKLQLLELYDLNELNFKTDVIPRSVYTKIKDYLQLNETEINNAKKQSINQIANNLKSNNIVENWNVSAQPLYDAYGTNIFTNVYNTNTFDISSHRIYNNLVKKFTPPREEPYRRSRVLWNETTKRFGDLNGQLYNVEYLDKDPSTHLPIKLYKSVTKKNQRTGQFEVENVIVEAKGKYPFIKRYLPTVSGETIVVWTPVEPPGSIKKI